MPSLDKRVLAARRMLRLLAVCAVCGIAAALLSACDMTSFDDTHDFRRRQPVLQESSYALGTVRHADPPEVDGWSLLHAGHAECALEFFTEESLRERDAGTPRIGTALAAALLGDHACAAWSMRAAVRLDPESVRRFRIDDELARPVDSLVRRYCDILFERIEDDDARFMLASLHYLRGDVRNARRSLGRAPAGGWPRRSDRRLDDLINERLEEERSDLAIGSRRRALIFAATPPVQEPSPAAAAPESPEQPDEPAAPSAGDPEPSEPSQPVDYDKLGRDLTDAANALDRFNRKLIERLERAKRGPAPREEQSDAASGDPD